MIVSITPTPARDVREQIRKLKNKGFGNNPAYFLHSQLSNLSLMPKLVKYFGSAITAELYKVKEVQLKFNSR